VAIEAQGRELDLEPHLLCYRPFDTSGRRARPRS
jgi:hypothetical protein